MAICKNCYTRHSMYYQCPNCYNPTEGALREDIPLTIGGLNKCVSIYTLANQLNVTCAAAKRRVTNCGNLVTSDRLKYAATIHYLSNGRRARLYKGEYQIQYGYGRPWVPYPGIGVPK